ncbi:MAG: TniQ family protein [Anaerolineales bacterium]|nr:TniQ family protein [Anaerolineales bacterium]
MTLGATDGLPLVVRRPLGLGESLYSYFVRLASLNQYPLGGLLGLALPYETALGRRLDNAFYPKQPQTYQRLSTLTRLSPAALYRATPHRYASLLALSRPQVTTIAIPGLGDVPALTEDRPYMLRSDRQAQFCAQCLREAAGHRVCWTPVLALVCLRHRCLLVSRCPGCGEAVNIASVAEARCRGCHIALAQAPVHSVRDGFGLFAQRTLLAWLEGRPAPANGWAASLPAQPPAALYYLATRLLTAILDQINPHVTWKTKRLCHAVAPAQLLALWTRAFRALVGWPEGFYQFCEARTLEALLRDCGPAVAEVSGSFQLPGPLFLAPNLAFARTAAAEGQPDVRWRQPDRVQAAERTRVQLRPLRQFRYLTIPAAARALGVPQVVVERLVVLGRLAGDVTQGEVRRADVLRLCQRWGRTMTVAEASTLTGLARDLLQGLVTRGVLQTISTGRKTSATRLARGSVCDFLLGMATRLRPRRQWVALDERVDEPTLDLDASVALAAQHGLSAADLLTLLWKGRLRACPQVGSLDLAAIRFPAAHLKTVLQRRRRTRRGAASSPR